MQNSCDFNQTERIIFMGHLMERNLLEAIQLCMFSHDSEHQILYCFQALIYWQYSQCTRTKHHFVCYVTSRHSFFYVTSRHPFIGNIHNVQEPSICLSSTVQNTLFYVLTAHDCIFSKNAPMHVLSPTVSRNTCTL